MVAYSFNRRFVAPIAAGLGVPCPGGFEQPVVRPKRQTIRAVGKRRHARPGKIVQLYHGQRTRQCIKVGEGCCTQQSAITLKFGPNPSVKIGREVFRVRTLLDKFASEDGFPDWIALEDFWKSTNGASDKWSGVIIYWEPINAKKA